MKDPSLLGLVPDWRAFTKESITKDEANLLTKRLLPGRPLGDDPFLLKLEKLTGRPLIPKKGDWPKGQKRK